MRFSALTFSAIDSADDEQHIDRPTDSVPGLSG